MNIFSFLLLPAIFFLFYLSRDSFFNKSHLWALFASAITAGILIIISFFISWGTLRSVTPTFLPLFSYSLKRETLLIVILALLAYWFFRGSLWQKNESIDFSSIFIFFGLIFWALGLMENLYNKGDSDLYQIIFAPILRASIVFFASFILSIAESFSTRIYGALFSLLILVYAALLSLSYGFFYTSAFWGSFAVVAFAILLNTVLFLFLPKKFGALALLSK